MRFVASFVFLLAFSLDARAAAGVEVQLEQRELGSQAPPTLTTLLVGEHQVNMQQVGRQQGMGDAVLFDAEKGKLWVLDDARRSYMEMDRKRAKDVGGQMDAVRAQMEAQLANLPPDKRALVEQAMKGRMPGGAAAAPKHEKEFRQTADRAEKLGHPCRRVEAWEGGTMTEEHWVTDWKELGISVSDLSALAELGEFMAELSSSMGGKSDVPDMLEVAEEMGGIPVVTVDYERGRPRSETVLRSAKKRDVQAGELQLPADYTPAAMPGFGGR